MSPPVSRRRLLRAAGATAVASAVVGAAKTARVPSPSTVEAVSRAS
ncbi:twin-arginine translocation signal domain-containing protein [Streptomyces sp. NPDC048845]